MRTVAVIQARMGSTRLPGKVLMDIAGKPMIQWVYEAAQHSIMVDSVVLSIPYTDTLLWDFLLEQKWLVWRGGEEDRLDRIYRAALYTNAELVIRLTADCPLVDPVMIDAVAMAAHGPYDYVSNVFPMRTYAKGQDVEAIRIGTLHDIWQKTRKSKNIREKHMFNEYLWNHAGKYRIHNITQEKHESHLNVSVDTQEDLERVREICELA